MRNFFMALTATTIAGIAATSYATRTIESSDLADQFAERNAQLCQLDARYCKS